MVAAVAFYLTCLLYAQLKTYVEHGLKHKASLRLETPHSLRISVRTRSPWKPGQHVFLRFLSGDAHALTAHPYTVCAMPPLDHPLNGGDLVFYVQPRGGLTRRLASLADKSPNATVGVLLEGPYGGMPARWSKGFDRTLLVAGGSGCGFTLALIEDWIRRRESCCAQLHVVLATRDPDMRIWYTEELQRLAAYHSVKNLTEIPGLTIYLYETGPVPNAGGLPHSESPSSSDATDDEKKIATTRDMKRLANAETSSVASLFGVKFFRGRPDTAEAVNALAIQEDVSVGVTVCGPSGMVYDVSTAAAAAQRRIVAGKKGASELWLHKEAFSY
jgi:ferric-chelate reductase